MSTLSTSVVRRAVTAISVLFAALAVVVFAKESGNLEPLASKRAVALVLSLLVLVMGNFMPKLSQPEHGDTARRYDWKAGWVLVLSGVAMAACCALLPLASVSIGAAVVGLVGLSVAGCLLILGRGEAPVSETRFGIRMGFEHMLLAIAWVLGIFLTDAVWGDGATMWMLVAYVVSSGVLTGFQVGPFQKALGQ